jgi:3-oxoadipate enol-lactonase
MTLAVLGVPLCQVNLIATWMMYTPSSSICTDFALEYPERVRSLILVDSILSGYTMSAAWEATIAPVWVQGRAGDKEGARTQWMNHALFESVLTSQAAETFRRIVTQYAGWHWVNKNPIQTLKPPALERLEAIQVPTLVVVGEEDLPDFHTIADTLTKRIPKARKQIISNAGHMCSMEAPEAFNQVVLEFLSTAL